MTTQEITENAVLKILTETQEKLPKKVRETEHSIHTLLSVLDMRAYTKGGESFEWVLGDLYREAVTELLINKLKNL